MGLIKCLDCRGSVSEHAEKCIHCGAPLERTATKLKHNALQQRIKSLEEERKVLVQKSSEEHKKYLEEKEKINEYYNTKSNEMEKTEKSVNTAAIIIGIIAILILIIHLFSPNWWLLLTIPLCLGTALGSFSAADGVTNGPYSDHPSERFKIQEERKGKLSSLELKHSYVVRDINIKIKIIDEELKKYSNT